MRRRANRPGVSLFAFQDIITAVVGIFILITLILVLQLQQRKHRAEEQPVPVETISRAEIQAAQQQLSELKAAYEQEMHLQDSLSGLNRFNRDSKIKQSQSDMLATQQFLSNTESLIAALNDQISVKEKSKAALEQQAKSLDPLLKEIGDLEERLAKYSARSNQVRSNQGVLYRDQVDSNHFVCLVQVNEDGVRVKDGQSKTVESYDDVNQFLTWVQGQSLSVRHFLVLVEPSGASSFDSVQDGLRDTPATFGFDLVSEGHQADLTFEWEVKP